MNLFNLSLKSKIKNLFEMVYDLPFFQKPFPSYPFGKVLRATKKTYLKLHKSTLAKNDINVRAFERNYGYQLNLDWWADLALHTQVVIKPEELNFFHGRLLYSVLCKYVQNIKEKDNSITSLTILETGTARGFSAVCMAKALSDMNFPGFITTIDCIPHNKKIYWNCIDDNYGPRTRSKLLEKWVNELSKIIFIQGWTKKMLPKIGLNRIHFAFLDAQHTEEDVLREFKFVSDRQQAGDILVFDDVTHLLFPGVCKAVDLIAKRYPYKVEKVNFSEKRGYAIATRI